MKKRSELLLRSLLFVPGFNECYLRSAAKCEADALIIDLEDSVSSDLKQLARTNSLKFMPHICSKPIFVRINDRDSGLALEDIATFIKPEVTGFMLPKIYDRDDILFYEELVSGYEKEGGLSAGHFKFIPLIETAAAVMNALSICHASQRVIAIAFGSEDYLAEIEGFHAPGEPAFLFPRSQIVNAARSCGVLPIDTLHVNVHDLDELVKDLKISKVLGFEGRLLMHPKELSFIHRYYSPGMEEAERAEITIRKSKQSASCGKQVACVRGEFVGPPLARRAEKILAKNCKINQKGSYGKERLSDTL